MSNCTFADNHAELFGYDGGISSSSMLTVSNSTFSGNGAYQGGGICNATGSNDDRIHDLRKWLPIILAQ